MKKLHNILHPDQFQRLNELNLQSQGVMALLNPDIIKVLALTDQQQKDMKLLNQEFSDKIMNMPMQEKSFKSEDPQAKTGYGYGSKTLGPESQQLQASMQKEFRDQMLAILTPDQRDQFEKLKGKKLDFKLTSKMSSRMDSRSMPGGNEGGR
jgi:hypothetical protein